MCISNLPKAGSILHWNAVATDFYESAVLFRFWTLFNGGCQMFNGSEYNKLDPDNNADKNRT